MTAILTSWALNFDDKTVRNLYNLSGGSIENLTNATRLTLSEVKKIKPSCKAVYFSVVVTISCFAQSMDRKPWYPANPDPSGKFEKVYAMGDGKWRCEQTGNVTDNYIPRWILRFNAMDFTDNVWFLAFNACAEKILKHTAIEAEKMCSEDWTKYQRIYSDALFNKYYLVCKTETHSWEDGVKTVHTVLKVDVFDPVRESEHLLAEIQSLKLEEKLNEE